MNKKNFVIDDDKINRYYSKNFSQYKFNVIVVND